MKRFRNISIIVIIIAVIIIINNIIVLNTELFHNNFYTDFNKLKLKRLLIFSKRIEAQTIYDYFTEDQLLLYILYADYKTLQEMAEYYNLKTDLKKEDLKKELLKFFKLEIKKVKTDKKEILLIKSADIILMDNIKKVNANVIELFGNIYLVVEKRIFKADHIIYNSKDNNVFAEGHVVYIDGKNTYFADKLSFNLKIKKGVFIGVRGKLDNYYVQSEILYALSKKSFYAENISFSTCDLLNPHYHVESKKIFYSDDYILSLDNNVYVGNSLLLWFPIYFSFERGSGFSGNFGMEYKKREGFKFYNTWHYSKNLFAFDYYENLGFYTILKYNPLKNIKLNFALGMGNYLFYDSNLDLWTTISPFNGEKKWLLRYGGNLKLSYPKLFKFLGIGLNLEFYSDTYLYSDVLKGDRLEKFIIQKFLRTYYPNIFPVSKDSLNQLLKFNLNILNTKINLSSNLRFSSYILDNNYIYTPGYKLYYLYSFSPFYFSTSKTLFKIGNSFISLSNRFQISSKYYLQYKYDKEGNDIFTNSEIYLKNYRFSLSLPVNLNIGNSMFKFNSGINSRLNYISSYNFDKEELNNSSSGYNFNINNSFGIYTGYFNFRISLSNNYVDYFYKEVDFNWTTSVINLSINGSLLSGIFKYSMHTGINLLNKSEKILFEFKKEKLNNLTINLSFIPNKLFNLKYSTSYKLSIFDNIQDIPSLKLYDSLRLSFNSSYFYLCNIKTKINNSFYYYYKRTSNYKKYLTNNFGLSFYLKDQFSISINIFSENRNLWVYDSYYEAFIDLIKSYNFFNIQDRISSYFNLKSISLNFRRNLHRFTMMVGIKGGFVLNDNKYDFKITYSFSIISIDFKDIEYKEEIEKIY